MTKEEQQKVDDDPLQILKVIDRLEVGPIRLEPQRIIAPYTLVQGDKIDSVNLIYRYKEDVFFPDDPSSYNMACIIASQVALNYGLFCDEIVFNGSFDSDDKRFIKEMASKTAQEIFVNKFLLLNPFIRGPAANLSPVKRQTYLNARLLFPDKEKSRDDSENWNGDPSRHAVLSSGGKESLLSFCLIREIGREAHPVFINESGRHWFTALNAYRYFASNVPNTVRVWTNADRVFSWMLKHLPFVRGDFARLQSDDYPIRLWTVAVLIFGALPLLKKRGISRLLIGDEYDTTRKSSYHGITHYEGLYDQSRYFDHAMTRYFHWKGWRISQFSILRSLSELLVTKILAIRYPELQRYQVSCHSAHKKGELALPCGHCEKCRRIVGMLMAIDSAPTKCGYTQEQIHQCLNSLSEKGTHQAREDTQHLAFLLKEKKLLPFPKIGSVRARQTHQITKLRFDSERSPIEGIPEDIREPLYRLFLDHVEGAVERGGRVWIDFDLLTNPSMKRPYPFSSHKDVPFSVRSTDQRKPTPNSGTFLLGELTWPEAQRRFEEVDVALLPVGSIEQHGPHLPLDTDAFDAEYLAHRVAEACSNPKPIVLPSISYGVSYHHADFSGTVSISPEALSKLVYEIGMSVSHHGITKLVIINGHGGNSPALHFAAQMINRDAHIFTCVDTGETSEPDIQSMTETPNDVHSGEIETSTTMAVRPHLVKLKEARKFIPEFSSRYLNFSSKRSVGWYAHIEKIAPDGVLGDPTKANPLKGKRMWEVMIKNLAEFVEDLKDLSLDEIYQKRY